MFLLPGWFLAVAMIFLGYGVLFLFRDFFEGHYYDVSFASVIGDAGLIGVILIGAEILKNQGAVSADWARSVYCHCICALAAIGAGAFLLVRVRRQQRWFGEYADRYHNIVVVPIFSYLVITLLPVIFYQGNSFEKKATIFFIALWVILVCIDSRTDTRKTKRLEQQAYLKARGVHLRSSRPPWIFGQRRK